MIWSVLKRLFFIDPPHRPENRHSRSDCWRGDPHLLGCQALRSTSVEPAKPALARLFEELSWIIRTDNGVPFATSALGRLSQLSVWWIRLGIYPELTKPASPAQNGRHERIYKTLKAEATRPPAGNVGSQQVRFGRSRHEYIEERPQEALGQEAPGSVYTASARQFPGERPEVSYPAHCETRDVSENGGIRWKCAWVNVTTADTRVGRSRGGWRWVVGRILQPARAGSAGWAADADRGSVRPVDAVAARGCVTPSPCHLCPRLSTDGKEGTRWFLSQWRRIVRKIPRERRIVALAAFGFLLCFMVGCQDKATVGELERFRAQVTVEEQDGALVRRIFDGLNARNSGVYHELYAAEYGWHFPSNNPRALNRDEEAGFVKLVWAGFPDIHWDVKEVIARDDMVVARFTAKGTHRGEFQGLVPTGNTFETGGIWTGRIKNGKVVEAREESDVLGWMQQLGMELKPKELQKKQPERVLG